MSVNRQILVPLPAGSREGRFIRRHKRFSVEFEMDGSLFWAHTNNTGAMLGLLKKDAKILVSPADTPGRKLHWTLERIEVETGKEKFSWAGVNTAMPNKVFKQAFTSRLLCFAQNYNSCKMEVVCGDSRLDACLSNDNSPPLWVECKNVSLVEDNLALFPDASSARARKHLEELIKRRKAGDNACMFFFVQRTDCCGLAPADFIDKEYAELFYLGMELGVRMYAYKAEYTPAGICLGDPLRILSREEYLLKT